jgi:putative cell wall-binding protein
MAVPVGMADYGVMALVTSTRQLLCALLLLVLVVAALGVAPAGAEAADEPTTSAGHEARVQAAGGADAVRQAAALAAGSLGRQAPARPVADDSPTSRTDRAVGSSTTFSAAALDAIGAAPGDVLVTMRDDASLRRMARSGAQALGVPSGGQVVPIADRVAHVTVAPDALPQVAARLAAHPDVLAIEPNVMRRFSAAPDDRSYALQWAHQQTNAEAGWAITTGAGATPPLIAILDSGIDATHPDLQANVVSQFRSANGQILPGTTNNDPCGIGHGTAVAGAAAARGDNGIGIAGAAWQARVVDIALTSPENGCPGGPFDSDTITAMSFAATGLPETPLVMNLSLGASRTSCSQAYGAVISQARDAGVVVVAAAGNEGPNVDPSIPGSCDGVISVGATTSDGQQASYSQTNPQVDLAAPGGDLRGPFSACPTFATYAAQMVLTTGLRASETIIQNCPAAADPNGDRLQPISGTSFATPYVAGVIGLMRQLAADSGQPLDVDQTEAILQATARDAGPIGRDCAFGFGIVDVGAALQAVQAGQRPALQPGPTIGTGSCPGGGGDQPVETVGTCPIGDRVVTDGFVRVSTSGAAEPICQAVSVSRILGDGQAPYAVLARSDDFADALAGSAVGFGLGPLLFTGSSGSLDPRTRAELRRVLDVRNGTPQVFIMGGPAAVPPEVDAELRDLGAEPVRVAGSGREQTAVAASALVQQLRSLLPFATRDIAFVAFGRNWPDAVGAGQMAAHYGIPVLVTNADDLHPDTRAELRRLAPAQVIVLGGPAAVGEVVVQQIRELGLPVERLAGAGRVDTTLAVSQRFVAELAADAATQSDPPPPLPIALNMDDSFADILSASLLGGLGNPYLPLAGSGTLVTDPVRQAYCGFDGPLLVIGSTQRIPDAAARQAAAVVAGTGC